MSGRSTDWNKELDRLYFGPAWRHMRKEMMNAISAYDGDTGRAWRDAHAVLHKSVWRYEGDVADDTADNNYVTEIPSASKHGVMLGVFSKMMDGQNLILKGIQDIPDSDQCKLTMSVQSTEMLKRLVPGMKILSRDTEAGRSEIGSGVRL